MHSEGKEIHQLLAGKDGNKDQSYFLCQLSQTQLTKALFPIGELTKPEVREIAAKADLITAEKKDSQGLCFIGKVRLPEFLQQKLQPKEGLIIEIPENAPLYSEVQPEHANFEAQLAYEAANKVYSETMGIVKGKHQGAHYFTKGQRKGLNVGGTKEPLFVIETDVKNNIIYTGQGSHHPVYLNKLCLLKMMKYIGLEKILNCFQINSVQLKQELDIVSPYKMQHCTNLIQECM